MIADEKLREIVERPRFTIISCLRNASVYARWCVESVLSQTEQNFQHVIVDDCSDDDSWVQIDLALRDHLNDPRVWRFHRESRARKLANVLAYWPIVRGEIIVELDGDDWFSRPDALALIGAAYDADPLVEATAGSHVGWPAGHEMRPITQPARGYRMTGGFAWSVPAPRTWKKSLSTRSFAESPQIYIDPVTSASWSMNADLALFLPALMHAERIASIDEILVEISLSGVSHDAKEDKAMQQDTAERLWEIGYQLEWKLNEHLLRPFKTSASS